MYPAVQWEGTEVVRCAEPVCAAGGVLLIPPPWWWLVQLLCWVLLAVHPSQPLASWWKSQGDNSSTFNCIMDVLCCGVPESACRVALHQTCMQQIYRSSSLWSPHQQPAGVHSAAVGVVFYGLGRNGLRRNELSNFVVPCACVM
jgi:hypothetical protein